MGGGWKMLTNSPKEIVLKARVVFQIYQKHNFYRPTFHKSITDHTCDSVCSWWLCICWHGKCSAQSWRTFCNVWIQLQQKFATLYPKLGQQDQTLNQQQQLKSVCLYIKLVVCDWVKIGAFPRGMGGFPCGMRGFSRGMGCFHVQWGDFHVEWALQLPQVL